MAISSSAPTPSRPRRRSSGCGVLAEHAGAALATAQLLDENRQQAAELRDVDDLLAQTTEALCDSLQKLERQTAIRERLSRVATSGDREVGIARAVHELTGLPVMAEDRFGNLLAAAGPVPDGSARSTPRHRDELLDRARRAGQPVRDQGRLARRGRPAAHRRGRRARAGRPGRARRAVGRPRAGAGAR